MQIIKQDSLNTISLAKDALTAGGVIVYPTETSYGLGCGATNKQAVEKLYKLKHQPANKPSILVVASLAMAEEYGVFSETARQLANKYWPGPLTLVVPVKPDNTLVPCLINQANQTVGLRWSSYKLVEDLSRAINQPMVSTSANISGQADTYSLAEVELQFKNNLDQISPMIDGGILPGIKPSTVVEVIGDEIKVLRQGELFIQV